MKVKYFVENFHKPFLTLTLTVRRKSNIYLDVPGANSNYLRVYDGSGDDIIRTFSTSNKGNKSQTSSLLLLN